MGPQGRRSNIPPEVFQYSGLGCVFAGGVLMFMGAGWLLDRWLGLFPVFMTLGALLGAGLSSASVWKTLQKHVNESRDGTDNQNDR